MFFKNIQLKIMTSLNRVTSSRLWQRAHLAKQNDSCCIFFHQVVHGWIRFIELKSSWVWSAPSSMRDDRTRPECFCQIWYINDPRPKALRSKTACSTVRCWFFEVILAPSAVFHSRYITSISCLWCCFCLHCSLLDWMNWSSAHRTWSLKQMWCYITEKQLRRTRE